MKTLAERITVLLEAVKDVSSKEDVEIIHGIYRELHREGRRIDGGDYVDEEKEYLSRVYSMIEALVTALNDYDYVVEKKSEVRAIRKELAI